MKVTREQAAENRERILATAATLFRERGFDGIGVADLMKGAGLTHGGFYGQFKSKEDLAAQACARALAQSAERWERVAAANPRTPLKAIAAFYVSPQHRDEPGSGCAITALGAEAPRREPIVRRAIGGGLRRLLDILEGVVPARTRAARRRKALVAMAGMVGAVVLSRAMDDPALSDEILRAVKEAP